MALSNNSRQGMLTYVLTFLLLLGASVIVGLLLSLFDVYAAAFVVGIIFLGVCLVVDYAKLFWLGIVCAFLIVGQLQYFAGIGKAFWLNYVIAAIA